MCQQIVQNMICFATVHRGFEKCLNRVMKYLEMLCYQMLKHDIKWDAATWSGNLEEQPLRLVDELLSWPPANTLNAIMPACTCCEGKLAVCHERKKS